MKDIFSLATFTAGAFGIAVFLTTLPGGGLLGPSTAVTVHASSNGCRLHGPLLANGGRLDMISRLSHV
jgi:hypothetical protein